MPPRAQRDVLKTTARLSRRLAFWLFGSAIFFAALLVTFFFTGVPLGQGYFVILYSPIAQWRSWSLVPLGMIALLAIAAVWMLAQRQRAYRVAGFVSFVATMASLSGWVWWAPPEPMNQQSFNMQSFSQDGAFVFEASKIHSIGTYLEEFPSVTLQKTVQTLGGTRILSNPPLMTAIAYAVRRAWMPPAEPPWIERILIDDGQVKPELAGDLADGVRMSFVLCGLWTLSGLAAYGLSREFLSPAGAAVVALIITFNPSTMHYMPGKDPAQLLTINLSLWAWFAAWRRSSLLLAAVGGAILTIGCTSGLVHIWIGIIAAIATLWQSWCDGALRPTFTNLLAAAVGGAVVCTIAFVTIGWNIPLTLWSVSRRWNEIQRTLNMNRAIWYAIGLPIFLLFLSPGMWALLGLSLRRGRRLGFGMRLAICTVAIMLFIYAGLGVTYELPRLWIAFLPTLTLGLAIDQPIFRGEGTHRRAVRALLLIVAIQFAFNAAHWPLFDARESEFRLMTNRFYQ